MIARLNCITDEARRRAKVAPRPGWPLRFASVDGPNHRAMPNGPRPRASHGAASRLHHTASVAIAGDAA
jgi:hypothetical protein